MKLAYLDLCGFRGYRKPLRIDFADRFTIVDGRNGVGKSTIFDAIEYGLTGTVSKYDNAKASGESIADYIWWTGEGPHPEDRYVEVGFSDGEGRLLCLRRTPFEEPDQERLAQITAGLVDANLAPSDPLSQLCATSIIRDEHIAGLSLDLKEADRYALLRDALGANDADAWINRASGLLALAKRRTSSAQQEVTTVNAEVASAARRVDEVRASIVAETTIAEAVNRLRTFASTEVPPDRLSGPVRERIAASSADIEALQDLVSRWNAISAERQRLPTLAQTLEAANVERGNAEAALSGMVAPTEGASASTLVSDARKLIELVSLGRQIGLHEGNCPLCAKGQSHDEFEHGMTVAEGIARRLDGAAAREAEREQSRLTAETRLAETIRNMEAAAAAQADALLRIEAFDQAKRARGLADDATLETTASRLAELRQSLDLAQRDLRILDTLRLNSELERAQRAETDLKTRLSKNQERLGRARNAETIAQELHDAARRAAAETLDVRLERVLPLMSELYRRLRPHPFWRDIEYSIRGDVRRFLKLQVGEELNPQFLFSSGQRRATGLAFLLSVNISLAWSRWRSILLDDPVQHVDDFRTVHLAEVTAQLVADGRQIICAVEDAALADLLCRRLPVKRSADAKRITLGPDEDGALAKLSERSLTPHMRSSVVQRSGKSVAS